MFGRLHNHSTDLGICLHLGSSIFDCSSTVLQHLNASSTFCVQFSKRIIPTRFHSIDFTYIPVLQDTHLSKQHSLLPNNIKPFVLLLMLFLLGFLFFQHLSFVALNPCLPTFIFFYKVFDVFDCTLSKGAICVVDLNTGLGEW